jgi:outer membrane protein TolC
MSARKPSRSVGRCLALTAVILVVRSANVVVQVTVRPTSDVGLASTGQPPTRLAVAAAAAADCGRSHAADTLRFCDDAAVDSLAPDASTQQVSGVLTLKDAIQRAVTHNLTILGLTQVVNEARGQQQVARSRLLPQVTGEFSALGQRLNLAALGLQFDIPVPGFEIERVVGPFSVLDIRARLSQTLVDIQAKQNHRAVEHVVRASEFSVDDAQDLIALAAGRTYVEAMAARSRVEATRAQVDTATAIHEKAVQQQDAGLATPLDVKRAQVQTLAARQRLAALEAAFAKLKIDLTRISGLTPTDQYDLDRDFPFSSGPPLTLDEALKEALDRRSDLKAAEAQVQAAQLAVAAARAQRVPSLTLFADYGANRAAGLPVANTYLFGGAVRLSIWEGGRIAGQVEQAMATMNRRMAERDDLRAQVEADIKKGYADLRAAETAVTVAELNVEVTRETLGLTRERFEAGVSDNLAVVQSQESLATAQLDYINSVLSHNLAKINLARSLGRAAANIDRFLQLAPGGR